MAKRNLDSALVIDNANSNHGDKAEGVQSRPAVRVEYPGEGEVIAHKSYTFHIAASPGAVGVEIAIDQGDWISCREASGLWWYDWSAFEKGDYEVVARVRMCDGITADSAPRRFSVD